MYPHKPMCWEPLSKRERICTKIYSFVTNSAQAAKNCVILSSFVVFGSLTTNITHCIFNCIFVQTYSDVYIDIIGIT